MKTHGMGLVFLLALCCGCGSSGHDDLIKEQIRCIEEAAQILEGVTDFDSAGAARPKLKKIIQRIDEQNARSRALPRPSADQIADMSAQNHEASQAALKRLNDAARKARTLPGCEDVVGEFNRDLVRLVQ